MLVEKGDRNIMENFFLVSYEGANVNRIRLTDLEIEEKQKDGGTKKVVIVIDHGESVLLPRSQDVISSIHNGILSYFSNEQTWPKGKGPPLKFYKPVKISVDTNK